MKYIHRKWRRLFIALTGILMANQGLAKDMPRDKSIELQKVFYHKGKEFSSHANTSDLSNIELTNLIVYFSHRPMVNTLKDAAKVNGHKDLVLFFPATSMQSSEVRKMVHYVNSMNQQFFSVQIKADDKPTNGVKLLISYDPEKVGIAWSEFPEIIKDQRPQPGIRVQFFNQELLKKLESRMDRAVLNTACAKKRGGVAIDCGHGGYDYGAPGPNDLKEKNVALAVGIEVVELLKTTGYHVIMTRHDDSYVALDQRTSLANAARQADLFLSIHANSSIDKNTMGIETFYFNPTLFKPCFNSLDGVCKKIACDYENQRGEKSKLLAQLAQEQVLIEAQKRNPLVVNRGTQKAILQVLAGTQMPAVLMEIGFLSKANEALLLADKNYQKHLAKGIYNGIVSYLSLVKKA